MKFPELISHPFFVPVLYILSTFVLILGSTVYLSTQIQNSITSSSALSLSETKETTSSSTDTILVDLSGAVINPGVYKLPLGSRVSDLLTAGGGFSSEAASLWIAKKLNLADKLSDTSKLYIPFLWEETAMLDDLQVATLTLPVIAPVASISALPAAQANLSEGSTDDTTNNDATKTNINTASSQELEELPGIGLAYATKIIQNRPYIDINDLENKSGIPTATISKFTADISF